MRNKDKFDTQAFHGYIAERTKQNVGYRYDKANEAKAIGFAMLISQLVILRQMSERKAMGPAEFQAAIDAAMQKGLLKRSHTCKARKSNCFRILNLRVSILRR